MSEDKRPELLIRYEQMIKDHANYYFDADDLEEIAYQYEIRDLYQKALEVIERGMSMHPGSMSLGIKRAKYLLCLDCVEEAEKQIYSIPHDSVDAVLICAELSFIQANGEQAISLLSSLLSSDEMSVDLCFDIIDMYLDFGYIDELKDFIFAADKVLANGSEVLRELALIYEDRQEYDLALSVYDILLDRDPYSYVDWFNTAKIHALKKDYDKAVDACDFALTAKEGDETILSFKGYCLYDNENYAQAIEVFKELLDVIEDKSMIYELIAECFTKLEKNEDAIRYLDKALSYTPDNANLYYQQASNYYDLGDISNAIQRLRKSIELEPKDADALAFLGEIYVEIKEFTEGKKFLEQSAKLNPENQDVLVLLGDLASQNSDYNTAISYYEQALSTDIYNVKLTFKLILAHFNSGDQEKAVNMIGQLDETTLQIDNVEDISEENRKELEQTKEIIDKLKKILKEGLNEDL